jgi:hypothetical protein
MRKLYEINSDLEGVLTAMALEMEENGEISDETVARLGQLQIEKDAKIEGMALWAKELKARIEEAKAEKARIAKIQAQGERELERLKTFISQELNGQKFKSARASVSYRTTYDCVDIDKEHERDIPAQYRKIGDPDKTLLKAALQAGEVIEGVSLNDHTSVIIK